MPCVANSGLPRGSRSSHVGRVGNADAARDRQAESLGHDSGDGEQAAIERDRRPDDVRFAAEAFPERVGDHHAAVVGEPASEARVHADVVRQGWRHRRSPEVLRGRAGHAQVDAALSEPPEHVEGGGSSLCNRSDRQRCSWNIGQARSCSRRTTWQCGRPADRATAAASRR